MKKNTFYSFARMLVLIVTSPFFHIQVQGKHNEPREKGYVLVSNHRSLADPIFIAAAVHHQLHFMAKAELFRFPPFSFILRRVNAFPIQRGKGDTAAIEKAAEVVRNSGALLVFPEGTRSKDGELLRFKSGAAVVAGMTEADVLPVYLDYKKGVSFFKKIRVTIGEPILNSELNIVPGSAKSIKAASQLLFERVQLLKTEEI